MRRREGFGGPNSSVVLAACARSLGLRRVRSSDFVKEQLDVMQGGMAGRGFLKQFLSFHSGLPLHFWADLPHSSRSSYLWAADAPVLLLAAAPKAKSCWGSWATSCSREARGRGLWVSASAVPPSVKRRRAVMSTKWKSR